MQPSFLQAVHELIADHPGVVRRGALRVDDKKMFDWRTRNGVVFAYEHDRGHVWVLDNDDLHQLMSDIVYTPYPTSNLWRKVGAGGKRQYGRHSALERIPELCGADLIRFTPKSTGDVVRILAQLDGCP